MNKRKAIKILKQQKDKIKKNQNNQWIIETASYVKDFFGSDSVEYSWICKFKWSVSFVTIDGEKPKWVANAMKQKPYEASKFLENCISVLKNKGVYKKPKINFFSEYSNWKVLGILFAVLVFGFWIGYWTKDFEIFSKGKKYKDSFSSTVVNTKNMPQNKEKIR